MDRFQGDTMNDYCHSWDEIDELPEVLDRSIYFEDKKFKAPILAGDILFHDFSLNPEDNSHVSRGFLVTTDNKQILRYNGAYYNTDGENIISSITQKVLGKLSCTRYKNEVINWAKDCSDIQIDREMLDNDPTIIGVQNGVLNIETMEFTNHSPGYFITSILPVIYDPEATCPTWEKFLQDVLYMDDIPFIQEMVGYCLYRRNPWAILVILLGHGRNGKTTFIKTITTLLGEQNVEHIPLQMLTNLFNRAKLYRKWANLCADIGEEEIKKTGLIKELTGGDPIFARDLYQSGFNFTPYCKHIFACNILPTCNDNTLAMQERFAILEFPNTFKRGTPDCDPFLFDKLSTDKELSGIFNWALAGLKRLLENKTFSPYRNLEDVTQYKAESKNPVKIFCDTYIESSIDGEHTKDEVYKLFIQFADEHGHPKMYSPHFSQQFKMYAPFSLSEGQSRAVGRKQVWRGIKIKDDFSPGGQQEGQMQLQQKATEGGVKDVKD